MNKSSLPVRLSRRSFLSVPAGAIAFASMPDLAGSFPMTSMDSMDSSPKVSSPERASIPITSWRTVESGFHNGPTTRFDRLDPDDFMRKLREAHTECVVVQTKSHWGYAYYNTKAGKRHPGLDYDLVSRWIETGHRNGLAVVAYYSGNVDTQSALEHPEWMGRNADGSLSWIGHQFAWCCHHSPYREYALGMYDEIAGYDFDGLFIDGSPWPRWLSDPLCYCQWCEAQYHKDSSESFLTGLDTPLGYRKHLEWLQGSSERYLDEVFEIVHKHRPGLPIWLNQGDPLDMSTEVLRKTSCLYIEPMTSPSGLSVGSIMLRSWNMPGPQVGLFWPGYTSAPIELDLFRTAAIMLQGTRPRFITDEQNMPDGRQRDQFFEWCSKLQEYVMKTEPHLHDLEAIPSLGVLFSEATRDELRAQRRFYASLSGGEFVPSLMGSTEVLTQTQYPVDILPSWDLRPDFLSKFDLIVLPETEALADSECQAIRDYVFGGGKILATWKPGLFDEKGSQRPDFGLSDVLGVSYVEEVNTYAGKNGPGIYLQTNGHPLSSFLGSGEVGILGKTAGDGLPAAYCPFVRVRGTAESILDYRPPYLVPDLEQHRFHSWNVAPPGNERVPMAATVNRHGRGAAVYIGVPLFRRYQPDLYWISAWIQGLVARLVPDPPIQVRGSRAVHSAFFRQGEKRLLVQLANSGVWTGHGVGTAAQHIEIVGRSDRFRPRAARLIWPKEEAALSLTQGDKWRVLVPEVALHAIVAIELG